MPIRITNLVLTARNAHLRLAELALPSIKSGFTISEAELTEIQEYFQNITDKANQLCHKTGGSPEDLPNPSFRAYQWMRFLSQRKWLLSHVYALADFYGILLELFPSLNQKNLASSIRIELAHGGYLYRSRKQGRLVILEVNEGFLNAPREVKATILQAALQRRTQNRLKNIKAYAAASDYGRIHSALQANNGDNKLAGRGRAYDLAALFDQINRQYFHGELEQPRLVWSARSSTRRLGTYQPDADTISISRRLDRNDVPALLVEYVLYHEMLHKKLGLKEVNGRRYAHTATFRKLERQFEGWEEAESIMKGLHKQSR